MKCSKMPSHDILMKKRAFEELRAIDILIKEFVVPNPIGGGKLKGRRRDRVS